MARPGVLNAARSTGRALLLAACAAIGASFHAERRVGPAPQQGAGAPRKEGPGTSVRLEFRTSALLGLHGFALSLASSAAAAPAGLEPAIEAVHKLISGIGSEPEEALLLLGPALAEPVLQLEF